MRDAEFQTSARRPVGELGNVVNFTTPIEIADNCGNGINRWSKIPFYFFHCLFPYLLIPLSRFLNFFWLPLPAGLHYLAMAEHVKTKLVPHLGGIDVGYRHSFTNSSLPTLVLINPFTTTSDYYQPEFESEQLTSKFNLLAVEPLGHGATRAKSETFTYWDSAIMTIQLLDVLGIKQAFVAGTSQGGWIAARIALLSPQKVSLSSLRHDIFHSSVAFDRLMALFSLAPLWTLNPQKAEN